MGKWFWNWGGLAAGGRGEAFFLIKYFFNIFFMLVWRLSLSVAVKWSSAENILLRGIFFFFCRDFFFGISNFYANGACVRGDM
jgi:hypothetical protein